MKRSVLVVVAAVFTWGILSWPCRAQLLGTAFTYQGELLAGGVPATGSYDLRFRLYDAATGGTQVGPLVCLDNVSVADGRFTVSLDFGAQFAGLQRFLEIEVRADTGLNCANPAGFTLLSPRQPLTGAPHALFALNAGQLNGQPSSFYLNAANLTSGTLADARLSSNVPRLNSAQTFVGVQTFSAAPSFTAAGAPFTVSSSTLVANLNADLLDGLDSTAFLRSGVSAAGGDLEGTYPNPTVAGLQTRPVSASAPMSGQVLKWDGSAWAPAADAGLTLPFSGSANVPGGVGLSITNTAASGISYGVYGQSNSTDGYGVVGHATATSGATFGGWFESDSTSGIGVFARANSPTGYGGYFVGRGYFSGDVGIGTPSPAAKLDVAGTARMTGFQMPTGAGAGRVLTSDASGVGTWQALPPPSGAAGGDLSGTYPNPTVARLQGRSVSSAAPTGGQVLKWDGSAWSPAADGLTLPFSGSADVPGGVGLSITNTAASGISYGVYGQSNGTDGRGVFGLAAATTGGAYGVFGQSDSTGGRGVFGLATATSGSATGVLGITISSGGFGVFGQEPPGGAGHAVYAVGSLAATGTKSFQIDHPLTPETHYLNHFCAEGPEPYNIYRGTVITDELGYATITLPDYFESINRDPTYHLTVVDDGEQHVFVLAKVVRKIKDNQFTIRTSAPNVEVSWEVKAVRHDRYVQQYGFQTVQEKKDEIKGKYLQPELYGKPRERGIHYRPDIERPAPAAPPREQPDLAVTPPAPGRP